MRSYNKTIFANRKYKLVNISLIILSICFFIMSFVVLPITYAKYVTETQQSGSSQVAEFIQINDSDVLKQNTADIKADPTLNTNYTYTLYNNGETLVKSTLTVTHTDNLPLIYSWTYNDTTIVGDSVSFNIKTQETIEIKLNIKWSNEEGSNNYKYSGLIDYVVIDIACEQTQ